MQACQFFGGILSSAEMLQKAGDGKKPRESKSKINEAPKKCLKNCKTFQSIKIFVTKM